MIFPKDNGRSYPTLPFHWGKSCSCINDKPCRPLIVVIRSLDLDYTARLLPSVMVHRKGTEQDNFVRLWHIFFQEQLLEVIVPRVLQDKTFHHRLVIELATRTQSSSRKGEVFSGFKEMFLNVFIVLSHTRTATRPFVCLVS